MQKMIEQRYTPPWTRMGLNRMTQQQRTELFLGPSSDIDFGKRHSIKSSLLTPDEYLMLLELVNQCPYVDALGAC